MTDISDIIRSKCLEIAKFLEQDDHGTNENGEAYTASDYIKDEVYDVHILIDWDRKTYQGARLSVKGGSPTIRIDTEQKQVIGYFGPDRVAVPYLEDNLGLDDVLEKQAEVRFNLNN